VNCFSLILCGLVAAAPEGPRTTSLGIDGKAFTLDGKPAFLVGISYYGALGASEKTLEADLTEMERRGLNWIRVWATWSAFENDVSAVTLEGKPREPFLGRLKKLVADCDRRGIVVDVTLSRGNGATGPVRLQTLEMHRNAVETILSALKEHSNWYLDLANERNVKDKRFVSFEELKDLRETARRLDPRRLVTASHAGDLGKEELRRYLLDVRVDFVAPHRPRDAASPGQTETRSREYLKWMEELGHLGPLHYQEPFRRGYGGWEPRASDFISDLEGARAAGAAGWCLHNGSTRSAKDDKPRRSFDLREKGLFGQLDGEEQAVLDAIRSRFRNGS